MYVPTQVRPDFSLCYIYIYMCKILYIIPINQKQREAISDASERTYFAADGIYTELKEVCVYSIIPKLSFEPTDTATHVATVLNIQGV